MECLPEASVRLLHGQVNKMPSRWERRQSDGNPLAWANTAKSLEPRNFIRVYVFKFFNDLCKPKM